MAASEVEAMRRAYAGIMLNMAQESAARVLAAERRAAALAGAVAAAKEDGVSALVRLKAIMESKVKEVELQSLQHVKKIKELEAQLQSLQHVKKIKELEEQLHGAQNNIASLQVELQKANTELEHTRKTLAEERINYLPTCNKIDSSKNISARSKTHLQSGSMSSKNKRTADNTCHVPVAAKENGAVQNMENMYRRSPDLPFMERNKKPKLYYSGCTQRIHALKQRIQCVDQGKNRKHATALNSRSKIRKNDAAKNPCHTRSVMEQILQTKFLGKCKRKRGRRSRPCYKLDNSGEHMEAECKLSDTSDENGCLLLLQALEQDLSPLKVSAGPGGEALTDLKEDLLLNKRDADRNLSTASPELLDILAVSNMQVKKRKRSKTVRVLEADFSDSKSLPESGDTLVRPACDKSMSDTELISGTVNHSDTPPRNSGPVLQYTDKNLVHQADANTGQFGSENSSAVLLPSTKSEIVDYGNLLVEQLEHKTRDSNTANGKQVKEEESCNLASDKADASTVTSLDNVENLKVSSGLPMLASEKPDTSVGSSLNKEEHAKASSGVSRRVEGARQIIYTFNRRKRKCASMDSTPVCAVPEKSSDLLSPPNKGEPVLDTEAQDNLIKSSPQGDNQLVQVAQQLILLSERN